MLNNSYVGLLISATAPRSQETDAAFQTHHRTPNLRYGRLPLRACYPPRHRYDLRAVLLPDPAKQSDPTLPFLLRLLPPCLCAAGLLLLAAETPHHLAGALGLLLQRRAGIFVCLGRLPLALVLHVRSAQDPHQPPCLAPLATCGVLDRWDATPGSPCRHPRPLVRRRLLPPAPQGGPLHLLRRPASDCRRSPWRQLRLESQGEDHGVSTYLPRDRAFGSAVFRH